MCVCVYLYVFFNQPFSSTAQNLTFPFAILAFTIYHVFSALNVVRQSFRGDNLLRLLESFVLHKPQACFKLYFGNILKFERIIAGTVSPLLHEPTFVFTFVIIPQNPLLSFRANQFISLNTSRVAHL